MPYKEKKTVFTVTLQCPFQYSHLSHYKLSALGTRKFCAWEDKRQFMIHFVLRCDKLAYFTNYKAAYKAIETKSKGIYI